MSEIKWSKLFLVPRRAIEGAGKTSHLRDRSYNNPVEITVAFTIHLYTIQIHILEIPKYETVKRKCRVKTVEPIWLTLPRSFLVLAWEGCPMSRLMDFRVRGLICPTMG